MIHDEDGNKEEEAFYELQKILETLPIYLKAIDIYDTILLVSDNIFCHHRNANDHRLLFDNGLIESSKDLILKINSLEIAKLFFIKKKTDYVYIFQQLLGFRLFLTEFDNAIENIWDIHNCPEHYDTLLNEYKEFKVLYLDWIKTFDLDKGYIDEYGFSIKFN